MDNVLDYLNIFLLGWHSILYIQASIFAFCLKRKRRYFWLTYPLLTILYYLIPILYSGFVSPNGFAIERTTDMLWIAPFFQIGWYNFSYLLYFFFLVLIFYASFKLNMRGVLFITTAAYNCQFLYSQVNKILQYFFIPEASTALFSFLFNITILILSIFILGRRFKDEEVQNINNIFVITFSAITLLVVNIFNYWVWYTNSGGNLDYVSISESFYCGLSALLLLILQLGFFSQTKRQNENLLMKKMIKDSAKQKQQSAEMMNIIELKYHDMKHQLQHYKNHQSSDSMDRFVNETEKALDIYDCFIKTGNEALNIVLSQKALICKTNSIVFSCICDGHALDFMDEANIYSLFGNAIDNAIEACKKEEEKTISVNVTRKGNLVCIAIDNTSTLPLEFKDGLPKTTKGDTAFHGFGTRSIATIVSNYQGKYIMKQVNGRFYLSILFTLQNDSFVNKNLLIDGIKNKA